MNNSQSDHQRYRIRIQISLIVVISSFIGVARFIPVSGDSSSVLDLYTVEAEIPIELIDITYQRSPPAAPARPRVPVTLPETAFEDIPLDLDISFDLSEILSLLPPNLQGSNGQSTVMTNPQRAPRVVRIVEAVTPEAVIRQNIRVELVARFTVNTAGGVEEVVIIEIKLRESPGAPFREVQSVGLGIIEAVYEAARQWQFRAATQDGQPVRAYSQHVFAFGRE